MILQRYVPVFLQITTNGGIKVDQNERVISTIFTQLAKSPQRDFHGANRLASNSLLEAIVYADRAAQHAIMVFKSHPIPENIPDWNDEGTTPNEEMVLITQSIKDIQIYNE